MNVTQEATLSPHEEVAAEVRALMARQRISGRHAAGHLGWTAMYMSRRLSGEIPFDVNDLHALADLLGVPPGVLFPPVMADAAAAEVGQTLSHAGHKGVNFMQSNLLHALAS